MATPAMFTRRQSISSGELLILDWLLRHTVYWNRLRRRPSWLKYHYYSCGLRCCCCCCCYFLGRWSKLWKRPRPFRPLRLMQFLPVSFRPAPLRNCCCCSSSPILNFQQTWNININSSLLKWWWWWEWNVKQSKRFSLLCFKTSSLRISERETTPITRSSLSTTTRRCTSALTILSITVIKGSSRLHFWTPSNHGLRCSLACFRVVSKLL